MLQGKLLISLLDIIFARTFGNPEQIIIVLTHLKCL